MTIIVDLFPKLRTPKNLLRYMAKKSGLRAPFDREHGKVAQTPLECEQQQRYYIQ